MCALAAKPRISTFSLAPGVELVRTSGLKQAFRPHRHDCYVVGITERGVQSFSYRGAQYHALPGNTFAIHPDEQHDGRPGTEEGYGYRAAYIYPALVEEALGFRAVPFVKEAVGANQALVRVLIDLFSITDVEKNSIALASCITEIADIFAALSDDPPPRGRLVDERLAGRVRDTLSARAVSGVTMRELELEHGADRFTITRHFRKCFGVSPQRYIVQRRVAQARQLIEKGYRLSDVAQSAGFADQSHMTRQFVSTLGITPGQWQRLSVGP